MVAVPSRLHQRGTAQIVAVQRRKKGGVSVEIGLRSRWAAGLLFFLALFFCGNCFLFSFLTETFWGKEEGAKKRVCKFASKFKQHFQDLSFGLKINCQTFLNIIVLVLFKKNKKRIGGFVTNHTSKN
jgi:hypothetical protein